MQYLARHAFPDPSCYPCARENPKPRALSKVRTLNNGHIGDRVLSIVWRIDNVYRQGMDSSSIVYGVFNSLECHLQVPLFPYFLSPLQWLPVLNDSNNPKWSEKNQPHPVVVLFSLSPAVMICLASCKCQ